MRRKATSPDPFFRATVTTAEVSQARTPSNPQAVEYLSLFTAFVYIAIDRKASVISSCLPCVYRRAKSGSTRGVGPKTMKFLRSGAMGRKASMYAQDADDVERVENHPLNALLEKPNPHWTGSELAQLDATFLEATGNSYFHIVTKGGEPVELWPLFPQITRVKPSRRGLVAGYLYGKSGAEQQFFEPEEVSHLRLPNPFDHYYGMPPTRAIFAAAQIYNAGDQHELAMIDNQARPDYAFIIKSGANSKEVVENLSAKLNERHRGAGKKGKHIVLSGDAEIRPLQWSPKELEWIQQQKWSRDTIAAAYSVPVSLLTVEDVNRANADAGMTQFMRLAILPRLAIMAERLTNDLLPLFGGSDGEFVAYENPVPEDEAFNRDRNIGYVSAGIWTPNEARLASGKDEMEGGDELRVAGALGVGVELEGDEAVVGPPPVDPARTASILDVLGKVQQRILAADAATAFLVDVLGMDEAKARAMVDAQAALAEQQKQEADERMKLEAEANEGGSGGDSNEADDVRGDDDKSGGDAASGVDGAGVGEPERKSEGAACQDAGSGGRPVVKLSGLHECACCKDAPPESDEYTGRDDLPPVYRIKPSAKLKKDMAAYFADQRDAILARMDEKPEAHKSIESKGLLEALAAWGVAAAEWDAKLLADTRMTLDGISEQGAKAAIKELAGLVGERPMPPDIAFNIDDPFYRAAFDENQQRFIRSVNDETERKIRDALRSGMDSGESIQQLRDRVLSVFDTSPDRATAIARTETARFSGLGRIDQMRQSGVPMKKRWLLAGGACSLCRAISERGDVGITEAFWQLGGQIIGDDGQVYENDYAPVQASPAHPNDRCAVVFVVDEEWLGQQ